MKYNFEISAISPDTGNRVSCTVQFSQKAIAEIECRNRFKPSEGWTQHEVSEPMPINDSDYTLD